MNKELSDFNFFGDPEVAKFPFEFYRRCREEAPVYQIPGTQIFFVTSYDDVKTVAFRHKKYSSEFDRFMRNTQPRKEVADILAQGYPEVPTMLTKDAPGHHRFRALVNPSFTGERVDAMAPGFDRIIAELLDALPDKGEVDFFHKVCVPLPTWVIADALGVPRKDMGDFKRWSDHAVSRISGFATPDEEVANAKSLIEYQNYFAKKIEECRENPGDDVVSRLVHARVEGEEPLNVPEILSIVQQVLVAGNETTTATLAASMVHLVQRPDILEKLRADNSLIAPFVEEVLRLETPSAGMWRVALEDSEVHGVKIPAGSQLMIRWASANRDEDVFSDPDDLNPERDNLDKHMAFGWGIHTCLGAFLARKELNLALTQIIHKIKHWELVGGQEDLVYVPSVLLRGLGELRLNIEKF